MYYYSVLGGVILNDLMQKKTWESYLILNLGIFNRSQFKVPWWDMVYYSVHCKPAEETKNKFFHP